VIIEFEKIEPSYVLRAIGAEEDLAHSSIRFGISRFTTEEEIDFTAETESKRNEVFLIFIFKKIFNK